MRLTLWLSGVSLALFAGCGVTHAPTVGRINTPGLTITAEDESYTLRPGERFRVTSWVNQCTTNWIWCPCLKSTAKPEHWRRYLKAGAKRVRVQHPAHPTPLYGILAFCRFLTIGNDGSFTRSYLVLVPDSYISATVADQISVAFEDYAFAPKYPNGGITWILFLSRVPFGG